MSTQTHYHNDSSHRDCDGTWNNETIFLIEDVPETKTSNAEPNTASDLWYYIVSTLPGVNEFTPLVMTIKIDHEEHTIDYGGPTEEGHYGGEFYKCTSERCYDKELYRRERVLDGA